jgi:hypothetical protein
MINKCNDVYSYMRHYYCTHGGLKIEVQQRFVS